MNPAEIYAWMVGRPGLRPTDRFDVHVLASAFTLALTETGWGQTASLNAALGLTFDDVIAAVAAHFPHALMEIGPVLRDEPVERSEREGLLLDLLWRNAGDRRGFNCRLAKIVARRAGRPNGLWQDLGLRNPGELSTLMTRHFPQLARRNARDTEWKEFLAGAVCRDAGHPLWTVRSCLECDHFFACFGEESDKDRWARARRAPDRLAAA